MYTANVLLITSIPVDMTLSVLPLRLSLSNLGLVEPLHRA